MKGFASTFSNGEAKAVIKSNEIKEIRSIKLLQKIELDFDSPRMKEAMQNLGVSQEECINRYLYSFRIIRDRSSFEKRGIDDDIISLRFKHF